MGHKGCEGGGGVLLMFDFYSKCLLFVAVYSHLIVDGKGLMMFLISKELCLDLPLLLVCLDRLLSW